MKTCKLVVDPNGNKSILIDNVPLYMDPQNHTVRATKDQLSGLDVKDLPVGHGIFIYESVENGVWCPNDISCFICKHKEEGEIGIYFCIEGGEKPWPTVVSHPHDNDLIVYRAKMLAAKYWEKKGLFEINEYNKDSDDLWFSFYAKIKCNNTDQLINTIDDITSKVKKRYYHLLAPAWRQLNREEEKLFRQISKRMGSETKQGV
jgi:hypothetical protein